MIMSSKQVVFITGSSTGFGRLFTETLARKGHTVFATMRDPGGRNAKNASEIRALAEKDSLPIHVLELDVTDDASVGRAVDAAVAKAGRIDVAINNAGYYLSGLEEAVTTEQAQRLMDTNFLGPVRVNRAVQIRVHQPLRLFGGDRFFQPGEVVAGVVDGYVDAAGFGNGGIHGPSHRGVVGHVQFKDVNGQRILFRERADFGGILGIAA